MKRPSFQFYPGDWRQNAKLRRCTEAARGAWMDVLCVLHDADEYGIVRWPLADLARSAGVPLKLLRELADKGVLKGADKGVSPYVYTPRHAGKDGDPVVLLAECDGPAWYCSRFVRDEWVRLRRGSSTQFTTTNQPTKHPRNGEPKDAPNPPFGVRQGDGPSSSSSTSLNTDTEDSERAARAPAPACADGHLEPDLQGHEPTRAGLVCRAMRQAGFPDVNPGDPRLLALLAQGATEAEFAGLAAEAVRKSKGWGWLLAALEGRRSDAAAIATRPAAAPVNRQQALEDRNRAVADQWLAQHQEAHDAT